MKISQLIYCGKYIKQYKYAPNATCINLRFIYDYMLWSILYCMLFQQDFYECFDSEKRCNDIVL